MKGSIYEAQRAAQNGAKPRTPLERRFADAESAAKAAGEAAFKETFERISGVPFDKDAVRHALEAEANPPRPERPRTEQEAASIRAGNAVREEQEKHKRNAAIEAGKPLPPDAWQERTLDAVSRPMTVEERERIRAVASGEQPPPPVPPPPPPPPHGKGEKGSK